MSDEGPVRLPKPQIRSLLNARIKTNLILVGISCLVAGCYMKFVFGADRKRAYAEFYKNYDIDQEFNRMRKKGVFDSCETEDDD